MFDTIDVALVELLTEDTERKYETHYEIQLIVNGMVVPGTFNALDFAVLDFSTKCFIRTCSCGEPGCAGYFEGFKLKYRKYSVEWRDRDKSNLKKFYSFDKLEYNKCRLKCSQLLNFIAEQRQAVKSDSDEIDYNDWDFLFPFYDTSGLRRVLKYRYDWYTKNRYRRVGRAG